MEHVLQGQTAVVTGAGSPAGIGFAIARGLLMAGAQIAITSTTERIYERARELDASGKNVVPIVADLTEEEAGRRIVDVVMDEAAGSMCWSTMPAWRRRDTLWTARRCKRAHTRIGCGKWK